MQVLDVGPPEQNIADKVYASSAANSENKGPPHPNIDSQTNAAAASQLELPVQMVANLSLLQSDPTSESAKPSRLSSNYNRCYLNTPPLTNDAIVGMRNGLEKKGLDRIYENLRVVVKEGEILERELRKRSRNKRESSFRSRQSCWWPVTRWEEKTISFRSHHGARDSY